MKMVSAAKFQLAERELKPARTFGEGAQGLCVWRGKGRGRGVD